MSSNETPAPPKPSTELKNGGNSPGVNNSNLYLVTFLATLFLLLFVSCGIVLRSYILRRRYQRQISIALANGVILTPRAQGSKRRKLGLRPRLYECWIAPLWVGTTSPIGGDQKVFEAEWNEKGGMTTAWDGSSNGRWSDMLPVTVQTVIVKRRSKESSAPGAIAPSTSASTQLSLSPTVPFPPPSPNTEGRLLPHVTPPSNWLHRDRSESQSRSGDRGRSAVHFADQHRPSLFSFPHHQHASTRERGETSRPRGEAVPMITMLHDARNLERANAVGASPALAPRQRSDSAASATWRTIVSPTPELPSPPVPPLPAQGANDLEVVVADELWPDHEPARPARGRTRLQNALGRLMPGRRLSNGHSSSGGGGGDIAAAFGGESKLLKSAAGGKSSSKYRVRTEMLQISVLVAMPSIETSRLYGDPTVVKEGYGSQSSRLVASVAAITAASGGGDGDYSVRRSRRRRRKVRRRSMDADADEVVEIPGEGPSDDEESESESEDEDEVEQKIAADDEDPPPLPELVLGVTRLSYRPGGPQQPVLQLAEVPEVTVTPYLGAPGGVPPQISPTQLNNALSNVPSLPPVVSPV